MNKELGMSVAAGYVRLKRLAVAWLVSAGGLLAGAILVAALGPAHYARGLLGLALVLAGWLHLVEYGVRQALQPTRSAWAAPTATRLLCCYCGFCLTQGLGLAAGCVAWATATEAHGPALATRTATLVAAKTKTLISNL